MMTADQAREEIRSPLDFLVRHHVDGGAPRMRAYERVGAQIGRTPAWVQRVLGRRPDASVGLHDALNIRAAYARLCDRIGAAADAVEAENQALRRDLDAALQRDQSVVALAQRSGAPETAAARGAGAPAASALVPTTARARRRASLPPRDVNDLPLWRGLTEE
ncbi:hypothetical protein [Methylobacterium brachythecii]|nr:hypothetical protein [Methylobacterium brachythecii]MBB3905092.1 hypothetical protein [Methylobacterium brachythecii]